MADAHGGADAERQLPPRRAWAGRGPRHLALTRGPGGARVWNADACPSRGGCASCPTCRGRRSSSPAAIPVSGSRRQPRWPPWGPGCVVTARNADKGRAAVAAIAQRLGGDAQVQLVVFDLADLSSVRRGAAEILEQAPRLDVLVNNAGLVLVRTGRDGGRVRGDVRHQSPRARSCSPTSCSTGSRASAPARIVNVASTAHNAARKGIPFDDLQSEKKYATMRVYGQSKLANILFTLELARRLEGSGVTANSLHPGTVRTGYGADGDARGLLAFGIKISSAVLPVPGQGRPHLGLPGLDPEVAGVSGQYFVKCKPKQPKPWAQDHGGGAAAVAGERGAGRPRTGGGLSGAGARHGCGPGHRPGHGRGAGRTGSRGGGDRPGRGRAGRAAGRPGPAARRQRPRVGPRRRGRRPASSTRWSTTPG